MTELFGRNPNWLERLLTRRVPQNLAAYAVACWGGVQFVDWLTERYQVSAYLTDFFVYTVILLVPSVVILAYFRGESGPTPWSWVEKAGIPLNLVVLAGVLFLNFQGKELGMVNTMVTVQDGNGRNVQRAVPKGAFRKHIALFFFQNTSGEQGLDWLRQGVPDLLATDLSQDLYLDVRDGYDLVERIQKATFSYRDDLGLGLERDIASYYRLEYLVRGTFSKNKNRYRIQVTLYETERVKQLTQRVYEGEDLFALVDRMSVQLKQDVGVPVQHLEQGLDMPIAEVSTQSLPALAHAITAQNLLKFDQDYRAAARQLEQAVAQDPTYAMGHYLRFVTFFNSGEIDRANREIRKAKRYIFKLTEYYQFVANSNFYFATGQAQEQRNVLKQWVALYPEDVQAHSRLARFYEGTTQFQEAIQASERVLELDPDQTEYLLQIGELYARQGQPQEALSRYQAYQERVPNQPAAYLKIGGLHEALGDFDPARQAYEKALGVDRESISAQLSLGVIEMKLGNFDRAYQRFQRARRTSQLPEELANSYSDLNDYYRLRGQWEAAVQQLPQFLTQAEKSQSPIATLVLQSFLVDAYPQAGQTERALTLLKTQQAQAQGNRLLTAFVQIGYLKLYLATGDGERASGLIATVERVCAEYGVQSITWEARFTRDKARIAELRGDYPQALRLYAQYLRERPLDQVAQLDLGRVYRQLKDWSQATTALKKALQVYPSHPEAHYELAQVLIAQGQLAQARAEIQLALKAWAKADPGYPLARRARTLALTLGPSRVGQ